MPFYQKFAGFNRWRKSCTYVRTSTFIGIHIILCLITHDSAWSEFIGIWRSILKKKNNVFMTKHFEMITSSYSLHRNFNGELILIFWRYVFNYMEHHFGQKLRFISMTNSRDFIKNGRDFTTNGWDFHDERSKFSWWMLEIFIMTSP